MECRPFKDPSFDKFMIEQDTGTQAIPFVKDTGAQTVQLRCFINVLRLILSKLLS